MCLDCTTLLAKHKTQTKRFTNSKEVPNPFAEDEDEKIKTRRLSLNEMDGESEYVKRCPRCETILDNLKTIENGFFKGLIRCSN